MSVSVPSSFALLMLAGLAGGCASHKPCVPTAPTATNAVAGRTGVLDWREAITDPDHVRLRAWRKAFVDSLAAARKGGHGAQIDAEGALLDPDVALDGATLPVGFYRCRVIKLGAKQAGHDSYIAYPAHQCQVRPSGALNRLVEIDGLQRPSGRLYADSGSRTIFLGTMILGDEIKPITYGRDQDRDMAGAVQRIGDKRWRMLLPNPAWESMMDVMELVPEAGGATPPAAPPAAGAPGADRHSG